MNGVATIAIISRSGLGYSCFEWFLRLVSADRRCLAGNRRLNCRLLGRRCRRHRPIAMIAVIMFAGDEGDDHRGGSCEVEKVFHFVSVCPLFVVRSWNAWAARQENQVAQDRPPANGKSEGHFSAGPFAVKPRIDDI